MKRPDTYIGSVEKQEQDLWVWDDITEKMIKRKVGFVPGLYKIFDEILVNASDNFQVIYKLFLSDNLQRDPKGTDTIQVDINVETGKITIFNDGKGVFLTLNCFQCLQEFLLKFTRRRTSGFQS